MPAPAQALILRRAARPATRQELSWAQARPRVAEVAPDSAAAALGLAPGDALIQMQGGAPPPVAEWSLRLFDAIDAPSLSLQFVRAREQDLLEADLVPALPGLRLEESLASLAVAWVEDRESYNRTMPYLRKLYETGDFARCRAVAASFNALRTGTPALAFIGAAALELAARSRWFRKLRIAAAWKLICEYRDHYLRNWTHEYVALTCHAEARYWELSGDLQQAEDGHRAALEADPEFRPPCEALARLTGSPADSFRPARRSLWAGRPFPLDYRLAPHPGLAPANAPPVGLADSFRRLAPGAHLAVISLGPYRGCAPCEEETKKTALLAKRFPGSVASVHLVTANAAPTQDHWLDGEAWLRASGLDFHVLHDPEDTVAAALRPDGFPAVSFVDAGGGIVEYGDVVTDAMAWRLIARPGAGGVIR